MIRRARLAAATLAACGALLSAAQELPGVTRHVLPNGLVLLLLEDQRQPLVSVGTMYRVGAKHEAAGATGLAHYCEHMNFRATSGLRGSEITEAITRLGGRWTGYTWIDQTWYAETVPSAYLERMLDLERERMSEALYDPADFQKERTSVLAELRSYDDPRSLLFDAVLQASFGVHPYRNNTIGWPADVHGVTRDEAYAFYRLYYHPNNAVLVVAGDQDSVRTLALVQARFGALPASGASTELRSVEPAQTGQRRVTLRQPGPHARVLLAYRAPALGEGDFPAMVLFDALLGGGKGLVFNGEYAAPSGTLLERALVTSGLASRASSQFQASRDPYVFTLGADVPVAGSPEAAERALFDVLADAAAREWTRAELGAARLQVRRGLAQDHDELAGRAHQLAFFEVSGGYEHLLALPERLERVTLADLREFAARRLRPEQVTVGWFEPAASEGAGPLIVPSPVPTVRPPVAVAAVEPLRAAAASAPMRFTLANGLGVTLAPGVGSGLVSLRLRLEAGSVYGGAAPVLAEWLTRPAPGEDLTQPAVSVGLHESPDDAANARWLELSAQGLEADVPRLLASLAARVSRAAPSASDFGGLRQAAVDRAREHAADPEMALMARARKELFGDTPLGRPPYGTEASLGKLTLADLQELMATRLGPAQARLVVAGQFDAGSTRSAVEASLGRWARRATTPRSSSPAAAQGPSHWTEHQLKFPGKSQNDLTVVWPGGRRQPHDRAATAVLLYLLGETGYAGRLGRALVEPGLVYWVSATLEEEDGLPGFLAIRTAASVADTPEVLRRIRSILEEAGRGGFSQAELDEARAYLRGKALRQHAASASTAVQLAHGNSNEDQALGGLTLARLDDTARRLGARGSPFALVAGP